MPNPTEDPTAYVMQGALDPDDKTLPATREGLNALTDEIARLDIRRERLLRARDNIKERIPR
jgi:hypothetical protein